MIIYLTGSLRNPEVPKIGESLRKAGFEIFDDWFSAGKIADDSWRDYEKLRGHSFQQALMGHAATHVFAFDKFHLNRAHGGIVVMPAGKSVHLECGVLCGQGKPVWLLSHEPERYDVMIRFLHSVHRTLNSLCTSINEFPWPKLPKTPIITVEDATWLAGLIEGEGSPCLSGPVPRFVLQMTDKDVIQHAARIFNSSVWGSKRRTKGLKQVWACGVAGLTAVEWMRILKPLLGLRRQQQILTVVNGWLKLRKYRKQDETVWRKWFGLNVS